AESAIRAVVARRRLDALLTTGRRAAEDAAAARLQARLDAYGLGLEVVAVAFQDVHPPLAVVDAFRDVSRAQSERQTKINDGRTYRAERLAEAEGLAAAATHAAEAARNGRVERARGEADAFDARRTARASAPELTDGRLYAEALAEALSARDK